MPSFLIQIRVRATDGGGRYTDATVTARVRRNLNPPIFQPDQFTVSLQDNEPLDSGFITVTATDADIQEPHNLLRYDVVGDTTAMEYFMVDEDTGVVGLKKSLALDPDRRLGYTVC
jgi:protocadherin Fat 4